MKTRVGLSVDMQNELFIAVVTGSGGMIGWGVADFFAKKTIDRLGDVATLFWSQCTGILPLAALSLFTPMPSRFDKLDLPIVVVLGIWSGLSYIPTYIAFGKGKVSLLSPLFATYAVVVTVLSAVLLGEKIPFVRQLAFATVFIGVCLITGDTKEWISILRGNQHHHEKVKGVREILLAICLYSVWLIALDRFLTGRSWVLFLLGIRIFSALSLYAYAKATHRNLAVLDRSLWKYLILVGCFDVAAFASVSAGFSHTPFVSIVAMLSGAFSLPTIILARTFLKERASSFQTAGSFVIVLGIMLLYLL